MPRKVKVFWEKEPHQLEETINNWLEENTEINIEYVTQSQVMRGQTGSMPVTICIWYTERS
jgi:hypothetical protein